MPIPAQSQKTGNIAKKNKVQKKNTMDEYAKEKGAKQNPVTRDG